MNTGVVDVPQLGTLVLGVPLVELVAEGEDAFLGAALFFVAAGSAKGGVELVLVEGVEQGLGLHQVGVYLRTVGEGAYAGMKGFHVAFDNEVPAVFLGIPVAELKHFLELPLGVDVHQGEGGTTGGKGFFGQTYHDAGVLANAIEHYGIFKLRCHFADNVNGLGFEFLQVAQTIIFCHDSVLFCVLLPIGAVYMSKGRHFSLIMLTFA